MSRRIWLTLLASVVVVAIMPAAASPAPPQFARSDGLPPPIQARIDSPRSLTPRIGPLGPQAPCLVVPRSDPAAAVDTASEPVTSTWQFEAPMPTARHSFGAAALPGTTASQIVYLVLVSRPDDARGLFQALSAESGDDPAVTALGRWMESR